MPMRMPKIKESSEASHRSHHHLLVQGRNIVCRAMGRCQSEHDSQDRGFKKFDRWTDGASYKCTNENAQLEVGTKASQRHSDVNDATTDNLQFAPVLTDRVDGPIYRIQ